jgi:UDP-sugar pyrophosphorylase
LPEFHAVLKETGGAISEFINPKYADSTKTKFKSSTRLECMMQDYPKLLKSGDRVGFTQVSRDVCFSPLKNDLTTAKAKFSAGLAMEVAASCENDFYALNFKLMNLCGAKITLSYQQITLENGIEVKFYPKVVLDPDFGVTLEEMKSKIQGNFEMTGMSTLVLKGDVKLGDIILDGVAVIEDKDNKGEKFFVNTNDKKY